jgi:hypothetical protein
LAKEEISQIFSAYNGSLRATSVSRREYRIFQTVESYCVSQRRIVNTLQMLGVRTHKQLKQGLEK